MVYTLCSVVNSVQSEFPAVYLSTLVEHLDSLIRTHARLMKDRRTFLWSLLPTRFTLVYRSNYSKLTSSLARMTSSLTLLSLNSLALTTPFLVSLPCFSLPPYNEQVSILAELAAFLVTTQQPYFTYSTFRGCVTAVRTLRYGCRKVKIGSVPGHSDMLDWIKGCFADSII